jgi:anti-anti-sigma regulatory factor
VHQNRPGPCPGPGGSSLEQFVQFVQFDQFIKWQAEASAGASGPVKEFDVPIAVDRSDAMTVIRLDGVVDISSAAELKTCLTDALAAATELRMDLAQVADIDVTWVQLVWAAQRQAIRAGTKFSFSGPVPEKIGAALRDTGFEGLPALLRGE